jgi:thiaminase
VNPDELIAAHREEWAAATRHPFLEAVRDGSLPEASFQTWLQQDYHFLSDLFKFQAGLLVIAPRPAQGALAGGVVAVEMELSWFEAVAARMSFPLDTPRHRSTEAYRQHLDVAAHDWSQGLTALWTGERTYLEAWQSAAGSHGAYREFVEHWTSPGFGVYVQRLEDLLGADADELTFLTTCSLERDFWEMAWATAPT